MSSTGQLLRGARRQLRTWASWQQRIHRQSIRTPLQRRRLRECEESAGRKVRAGAGVSPLAVAFAAILAGRDLD